MAGQAAARYLGYCAYCDYSLTQPRCPRPKKNQPEENVIKIASFNLENMFDRAIALSSSNWEIGKPALEAHRALNLLFEKPVYSPVDKAEMLALLAQHDLLGSDGGPLLELRKIRGQLFREVRVDTFEIVASGRRSWIGWVELKSEPVNEVATQNTARVIAAMGADIQAVVEAEDRTTMRLFNQRVISDIVMDGARAKPFDQVMLVDGNDERGIDVGLMTRAGYPILSIRSHVHDSDAQGPIFSRDCCEYQVGTPSGGKIWVLVNHFKSKGYGNQTSNNEKRLRQTKRVREIYEMHLKAREDRVVILGDFNEIPGNAPLDPLLREGSSLKDIFDHPLFDNRGRPGTHGNCTASGKLDYILLSPKLFAKVRAAGVERRGMWGGANGTLWPHFPELTHADQAASDHAGLWVDLKL